MYHTVKIFFHFQVRNDQCKLSSHDKSQIYLSESGENEWNTREVCKVLKQCLF